MRFPDRLIRQTTPTRGRCDETRETDWRSSRLALALALVLRVQKRLATSTSLEGTDCEPIVCPRPQRRQGCEGLSGVTPIIDFMSFVIRSIAVMACRSSIEVTTCGDSAGFSVVTTQGWM